MQIKHYKTAMAFKTALQERLKTQSQNTGIDLQRLQRRVAFDRLLCRLFHEDTVPWVLKGGHVMELRIENSRATKDIDLALKDTTLLEITSQDEQNKQIHQLLVEKSQLDLNDFFKFEISAPTLEIDAAPYGGARYPVTAFLDSKLYIRFSLDIGIGDSWLEPHDQIELYHWLEFAGIETIQVPVINCEQHFAEKIHAYTLPRGERINSRVKDLIDLILLLQDTTLDQTRMVTALKATFKRRGTHILPSELLPPPVEWEHSFQQLAKECAIEMDLTHAFEAIQAYWNQIKK